MSYTPKNWVCGETITADGLNNMEDGIQEALECCSGGGDSGYECSEATVTFFEETVMVNRGTGELQYIGTLPESVVITFNGDSYECAQYMIDTGESIVPAYGAPFEDEEYDWSDYPFALVNYVSNEWSVDTENDGEYTIKAQGVQETITVDECFTKAVQKVALPEVSILDDGKILQVENGKWNAVQGQSAVLPFRYMPPVGEPSPRTSVVLDFDPNYSYPSPQDCSGCYATLGTNHFPCIYNDNTEAIFSGGMKIISVGTTDYLRFTWIRYTGLNAYYCQQDVLAPTSYPS